MHPNCKLLEQPGAYLDSRSVAKRARTEGENDIAVLTRRRCRRHVVGPIGDADSDRLSETPQSRTVISTDGISGLPRVVYEHGSSRQVIRSFIVISHGHRPIFVDRHGPSVAVSVRALGQDRLDCARER